jgi:ribonucleoside-diphosphate reductase beta chain
MNGVEHANFFENRATEYAKGALTGSWADVWASASDKGGEDDYEPLSAEAA